MKSFLVTTTVVILFLGFIWGQIPIASAAYSYKKRELNVRTTAYTHSESDHIEYGRKTALGTQLKFSREYTSAASDWSRFPVGTEFRIKGLNRHFVIDDYGSALLGKDTIDLYFTSKSAMNRWGVKHVDIVITKYGDFEKSREILSQRTKYHHCRKMLAAIDANGNATAEEVYETVPEVPSDIDSKLMAAASIPKSEWESPAPEIEPDPKQPVPEDPEVLIADNQVKLKPQRRMRAFREIFASSFLASGQRFQGAGSTGEIIRVSFPAPTSNPPNADKKPTTDPIAVPNHYEPIRKIREFRPL